MRVLNPAVFPRALSGFAACGASHSLPASLPKRRVLAGLVTLISAVGTVPCVVLWLKAVSAGDVLLAGQTGEVTRTLVPWSLDRDSCMALVLGAGPCAEDGRNLAAMDSAAAGAENPYPAPGAGGGTESVLRAVDAWRRLGCALGIFGVGVGDAPTCQGHYSLLK